MYKYRCTSTDVQVHMYKFNIFVTIFLDIGLVCVVSGVWYFISQKLPTAFLGEILTSMTHLVLVVQLSSMKSDYTNSRLTTRVLSEKMKCSLHLHSIGRVQECGAWVLECGVIGSACSKWQQQNQRATILAGFLAVHRSTAGHKHWFLYRSEAGNENLCLYINMK